MTGSRVRRRADADDGARINIDAVWCSPEITQVLWIKATVVQWIHPHRQTRSSDREAGGQLFGTVNTESVTVVRATGPYQNDQRSRFHYRSNPSEAQRAIDSLAKEGLIFLGEWHTHAEPTPRASAADISTMELIRRNSKTNTSMLFLVIAGYASPPNGIAVYSTSKDGLEHWNASPSPNSTGQFPKSRID